MASPLVLSNDTLFVMAPTATQAPQLTAYSARGLTQTLEFVARSDWLARDVNGTLRNMAEPRFRKYISDVSCNDAETPCIDGGWVGAEVLVSCACELAYAAGGAPTRPAVAGSFRSESGGVINFYRPLLTMMVAAVKTSFREYGGQYAWQIRLEEV